MLSIFDVLMVVMVMPKLELDMLMLLRLCLRGDLHGLPLLLGLEALLVLLLDEVLLVALCAIVLGDLVAP